MADNEEQFSAEDLAVLDRGGGESDQAKGGADQGAGKSDPVDQGDKGKADQGREEPARRENQFPDNWREQYIVGLPEDQREKAKNWLSKRSSPYEVLRAGINADQKIQDLAQNRVKVPTGKEDDPKDVAAFRKHWGVPEKPSDYKVELPKEYGTELSATDKEMLDEFLADAHSKHMNQAQVDHSIKAFWAVQQRMNAYKSAEAMKVDTAAEDDIRVEMGKDYRTNLELINRVVGEGLSKHGWEKPEDRREFLSMRLENGVKLGSYKPFVMWLSELAREKADDGTLEFGDSGDAVDIDRRIDEIIGTRDKDIKEYERLQPELKKLITIQNRRNARR